MKKNVFGTAMSATALLFMLVLAACPTEGGDGGGGGSPAPATFPFENLHKGTIYDSVLATFGLGPGALNSIAAGSSYQGWYYNYNPGNEFLQLYWTGRNETDFNNMKTSVETLLGGAMGDIHYYEDIFMFVTKFYGGSSYGCSLILFKKDFTDYYLYPAGTMYLNFGIVH